MLRIRLQRTGRRNHAHYRIVVTEKKAPVKGKFIEKVGWLDPHSKKFEVTKNRVLHWLNVGAQPSNTVSKLLNKQKISHKLIVISIKPPRKPKSEQVKESSARPEQAVNIKSDTSASESNPTQEEVEPKLAVNNQQAS